MPRQARVVVPGVAHHVTQRGTGRQLVFYTRTDRLVYLRLLKEHGERAGVRILAYCLMPNHIHLIVVPETEESLATALRRAHGRYAQYFNARKSRSGHLWQNRFYSCPMDAQHLWTAMRYVEMNPVRAALAADAGGYEWSSAGAHLSGVDGRHLLDMGFWAESGGTRRWEELHADEEVEAERELLRRATHAGNPLGSKAFQDQIREIRKKLAAEKSGASRGFADQHGSADERCRVAV